MGVTVGYGEAVAEGSGAGLGVGVGGAIKLSPPQAIRNKASTDIPMKCFFVIGG